MDRLGGTDAAIALVKERAEIPADEEVTLVEVSVDRPSPAELLSGAGALSRTELLKLVVTDPAFLVGTFGFVFLPLLLQACTLVPLHLLCVEPRASVPRALPSACAFVVGGATAEVSALTGCRSEASQL